MKKKEIYLLIIFAILSFISLLFYILNFYNRGISSEIASWGSFGDYLAGSIGLIAGIFTTILIYFAYKSQKRQEFENSFEKSIDNYYTLLSNINENFLNPPIANYQKGREIFGNTIGKLGKIFANENDEINGKQPLSIKESFNYIFFMHYNVYDHYLHNIFHIKDKIFKNENLTKIEREQYFETFGCQISFYELIFIAYYIQFKRTDDINNKKIFKKCLFKRIIDDNIEFGESLFHKEQVNFIIELIKKW